MFPNKEVVSFFSSLFPNNNGTFFFSSLFPNEEFIRSLSPKRVESFLSVIFPNKDVDFCSDSLGPSLGVAANFAKGLGSFLTASLSKLSRPKGLLILDPESSFCWPKDPKGSFLSSLLYETFRPKIFGLSFCLAKELESLKGLLGCENGLSGFEFVVSEGLNCENGLSGFEFVVSEGLNCENGLSDFGFSLEKMLLLLSFLSKILRSSFLSKILLLLRSFLSPKIFPALCPNPVCG